MHANKLSKMNGHAVHGVTACQQEDAPLRTLQMQFQFGNDLVVYVRMSEPRATLKCMTDVVGRFTEHL